jgi:hypothetical protein
LLFHRRGGFGGDRRGAGEGDRRGGGNAPLFFEQLGQLGGFQDGQGGKVFNDFGKIGHL